MNGFANRSQWLSWRKSGLGGSDIASLFGDSPWRTIMDLYEDKITDEVKEQEPNFATDLGNEAEPKIRMLFELASGMKSYNPACMTMAEYPHMLTSLDGKSFDGEEIVEIKLSGAEDYNTAKVKKEVPKKYMWQVQHNLLVSGAKKCFFLSYPFGEFKATHKADKLDLLAVVEVFPDKDIQQKILEEGTKFWTQNVIKNKPPLASNKDFLPLTGYSVLAQEWKNLKKKSALIDTRLSEIETELKTAAEKTKHPRLMCAGIKLTQTSRIGNVDYKKIPELKGVDLEKYRGKGSIYWTIKEASDD